MSGSFGSGNFGAIPASAGQIGAGQNQLGSIFQNVQDAGNVLKTIAQVHAANAYQQSIDPATGLPNTKVLGDKLASDRLAALGMQDVQQNAATLQGTSITNNTNQLSLQTNRYANFANMMSGLAGRGLTQEQAKGEIGMAASAEGIPSTMTAALLNGMPATNDQGQLDQYLITIARSLSPEANQAQLTPSIDQVTPDGNKLLAITRPSAVQGQNLGVVNGLANALTPTVTTGRLPDGSTGPIILSGNPGSGGISQTGQAPPPPPPLNTNPDSVLPAALQGPAPGNPTPTQPPAAAEQAVAPGGITAQPTGVTQNYSEGQQQALNGYLALNTGLQKIMQTAGTRLGNLDDMQTQLNNTTTGVASKIFNAGANMAAEFGLPGAQTAGNYESFSKLASAFSLQGFPNGVGTDTDYKTSLNVAATMNPTNSKQANQGIIAFNKGAIQAQYLAAQLAQQAGVLQNANKMSDGKNFDYQGVQGEIGKINPMVYTYENMNQANQTAFRAGMSKAAWKEFSQDYAYVQQLQESLSQGQNQSQGQ
jgi:hypothetical protein